MDRFEIDLRGFADVKHLLGFELDVDPLFFMTIMVTPAVAASVLKFAFPSFVEYRDAVFLELAFRQDTVDLWFERLRDASAVEQMVNHIHLWDVFAAGKAGEDDAVRLVEPLAACWEAALSSAFPGRCFSVEAIADGDYGPELTFSSVREAQSL